MDRSRSDQLVAIHPSIANLLVDLLLLLIPLALLRALGILIYAGIFEQSSLAFEIMNWIYRAACAVLILEMVRRYFDQIVALGRTRVIYLGGILALKHTRVSVRYTDIREIQVSQSLLGRVLNYGDLSIGTAAKGEYEIVALGVGSPQKISQVIDDLRRSAEQARSVNVEENPVVQEPRPTAAARAAGERFQDASHHAQD